MRCKARIDFDTVQSSYSKNKLNDCLKSKCYPFGEWGNHPLVVFIGKTGYGKSTTINSLLGKNIFETDDICSCTRESDYALLTTNIVPDYEGIVFCDMPGIGESEEVDTKYRNEYYQLIPNAACVVYVLRADQRDYERDLNLLKDLKARYNGLFKKIIFVMNFADKIEPINRGYSLSEKQIQNLWQKKQNFCKIINTLDNLSPHNIIHTAAPINLNTKKLLDTIINKVLDFGYLVTNSTDLFACLPQMDCEMLKIVNAARSGDSEAMNNLGCFYSNNIGGYEGNTKAFKLFKLADTKGSLYARANLGVCYYFGEGTAIDYIQAFNLFLKPAKEGIAFAQKWLGDCYYEGKGVSKNYVRAFLWYKRSADQGDSSAQCQLGECYFYGHGTAQSYSDAYRFYIMAAKQNNAFAQYNCGWCHEYGLGNKRRDKAEAIKWYKKAAKNGSSSAQQRLNELGHHW